MNAYYDRMLEAHDLSLENARLSDKIIALETRIDQLIDRDSTLERRVEYWRKMYITLCKKYKKLESEHEECKSKYIILYR